MSANAEEVTQAVKKTTKKSAPKKSAPKKAVGTAAAKPRAKKLIAAKSTAKAPVVKKAAKKTAVDDAPKRGRPAGKKAVSKRRVKKGSKQFGYCLVDVKDDVPTSGAMQGPFSSESDALDDAGVMAGDSTTIVLFRETRRGRIQKQTKFVAGR